MPRHSRIVVPAMILALICLGVWSVSAVQRVTLAVADISGPAWSARDIEVTLQLDDAGQPAGDIRIGKLEAGLPTGPLNDVRLRCPTLVLKRAALACRNGRLEGRLPGLAESSLPVSIRLAYDGSSLSLQLSRVVIAFNAADGSAAADGLTLNLSVSMDAVRNGWQFDLDAGATAGQGYLDPVFTDFSDHRAHIQASGRWGSSGLRIQNFLFEQAGVLQAEGQARADGMSGPLQSLELTRFQAELPAAYSLYAQPFLIGTALDTLTTEGRISGSLAADDQGLSQLSLRGQELAAADRDGRFRVAGGSLDADWRREGNAVDAPVSHLAWETAALYRIDLGAARLDWRATAGDVLLARPLRIPLLEGALTLESLEARNLTGESPQIAARARLDPVRLDALTEAFGWPAFGGTLAGALPDLTYRDGRIELAGGLTASVFDGRVSIDQLRLENLFGARPLLAMDATARSLDLEAVTGVFAFGRIEGRLDADVENLRMLGWQPVAFDAWLRTPENDDSRHRISQRAVDNLASLGGGTGLVSRGFLRFFDDFAYDRLGIGCRLQQGVCRMRGLGPADGGGFVIVRGSSLPRIDVIGHNRVVDWPTLLEQLRQATASEGPTVQ